MARGKGRVGDAGGQGGSARGAGGARRAGRQRRPSSATLRSPTRRFGRDLQPHAACMRRAPACGRMRPHACAALRGARRASVSLAPPSSASTASRSALTSCRTVRSYAAVGGRPKLAHVCVAGGIARRAAACCLHPVVGMHVGCLQSQPPGPLLRHAPCRAPRSQCSKQSLIPFGRSGAGAGAPGS